MKKLFFKAVKFLFETPASLAGAVAITFIGSLVHTGIGMALVMLTLIFWAVYHMNDLSDEPR